MLKVNRYACVPAYTPPELQMDRASEFVARSLYVFESAFMEAFRPVEGACRMDSQLDVNKAYLAAMFRHMQVGML